MPNVSCPVKQELPPVLGVSHPIHTSAGSESHSKREGVGVKRSLDLGRTASRALLYSSGRLVLQQHQWVRREIDDMVLLLLKLS